MHGHADGCSLLVIIVNHCSGERLARALASLGVGLGDSVAWRALVVDNHSHDGSERAAETAGGRVSLLRLDRNLGFGAAVNLVSLGAPEPWLLLLNPDAELQPGVWSELAKEIACHPECDVVGPGVLDRDGSPQGSARGDPTLITGLFGRTTFLRRRWPGVRWAARNVVLPSALPPGEPSCEVDWVAGSCLLVRRRAFEHVGGFDERYFMYFEDADLCRRIRAAGGTVRYRPAARVMHHVGVSSGRVPRRATREFHRSAYLYYATYLAQSPLSPRRWLARALLSLRCHVKLMRLPRDAAPS
ncbi:MAG: glycosyltransferase family 2 protein [Vicinamibacteraceae bacterium]